MHLCIDEKEYNKLINLLNEELKKVQLNIEQLSLPGRIKNYYELQNAQNVQFELQILIHTLMEFPQFDEVHNLVIVNITEINKDRLIGFLLSKV